MLAIGVQASGPVGCTSLTRVRGYLVTATRRWPHDQLQGESPRPRFAIHPQMPTDRPLYVAVQPKKKCRAAS
jgi:hypothetical protein